MTKTVKTIVEEALGGIQRVRGLWTANYYPALPIAPQVFEIGGLLPVMLYMARFGHRRGRGEFVKTFGKQRDGTTTAPTVSMVADRLRSRPDSYLDGFDDGMGGTVLGDLLLAWCLENRKHAEGYSEQVQRIYPTHYLASWVDLPAKVADLRGVPEFLTALLAHQDAGEWIEPRGRGRFPVGVPHADNCLLALFGRQMEIRGPHGANLGADTFNEAEAAGVGIDELLAVRMAQACGSAPLRAHGGGETERIPNRHALAAARRRVPARRSGGLHRGIRRPHPTAGLLADPGVGDRAWAHQSPPLHGAGPGGLGAHRHSPGPGAAVPLAAVRRCLSGPGPGPAGPLGGVHGGGRPLL